MKKTAGGRQLSAQFIFTECFSSSINTLQTKFQSLGDIYKKVLFANSFSHWGVKLKSF